MRRIDLTSPTTSGLAPTISVIMANYRCAQHLPAALRSVLSQTVRDLEVIVSDDASPDDSVAAVQEFVRRDPRVRLVTTPQNGGPGAARNKALDLARGEWIAIVDSDDLIHPERFEIMLAEAKNLGADIVADDLMFFSEAGESGATLLGDAAPRQPQAVSSADFIRSNTTGSRLPSLGYVKPLIRRSVIGAQRYDETVRIGEDYDFLLRCLLNGGRFFLLPELLYFYRRHAQSVSHRLSHRDMAAMVDGQRALVRDHPGLTGEIKAALDRRMTTMRDVMAFEALVASLKARKASESIGLLVANPKLAAPLLRSAIEHFRKARQAVGQAPVGPACVIVREPGHPTSIALNLALDLYGDIRTIDAPRVSERSSTAARAIWSDLTKLSSGAVARVVAYGLDGLHAAPYALPGAIAAVIENVGEFPRALAVCRAIGAPLVISDSVKQSLIGTDLESRDVCPGYHRVIDAHPPTSPRPASAVGA